MSSLNRFECDGLLIEPLHPFKNQSVVSKCPVVSAATKGGVAVTRILNDCHAQWQTTPL